MSIQKFFHALSYFQYPIYLTAIYYYALFFISFAEENARWAELNNVLVFLGIAISFSTLQDTSKTQNKFSERVWKNPKKGKIALFIIGFTTLLFLIFGLIGFLNSADNIHKEISFGMVVTGIGLISMLKAAKEMFENHRIDKILKKVLKEDEDLLHKLSK